MNRPSDLKLHQLRYLIAIADQGSLRLAAQSLGVSAAAVSKGLQELENAAGSRLCERQAQGLALTAGGRALLVRARLIVAEIDGAVRDLSSLQRHTETRFSLGVTPWFASTLLAPTVKRFLARRPDVSLNFHETVGTTYTALREGTIDMAIGLAPSGSGADELVSRPLFSYSQAVVCRAGHPCQGARSLAALGGQSWILSHEIEQYKAPLRDFFFEHYRGAAALAQTGSIHYARSAMMALDLVESSDILSILPWPLVEALRDRLAIVPLALRETMPENVTSCVTRRNVPVNGCIGEFVDALMETVAEASREPKGPLQRLLRTLEVVR
jgi:DNA-binding transcriptional LysR family regulator